MHAIPLSMNLLSHGVQFSHLVLGVGYLLLNLHGL